MSWSIGILGNDVRFDKETADALTAIEEDIDLYDIVEHWDDGSYGLCFDPDHHEHMDFLWRDEILAILLKGKANGRVLFGSIEGDNAGSFWGHEFDNGAYRRLTGSLSWCAVKEE